MIQRPRLQTPDGLTLETKVDIPERSRQVTVLCHPHPLQGGSMNAPLMIAIARRLVERGHTVVRFNFRGTGESTGEHDFGSAETLDVGAAIEHARGLGGPVGVAGWSFGAGVALRWLAEQTTGIPYSGVAPAGEDLPPRLPPGPKRIILGTRDQVIDSDRLRSYAMELGIDLVLTPGDHFFHGRGAKIGDLVAQGLEVDHGG